MLTGCVYPNILDISFVKLTKTSLLKNLHIKSLCSKINSSLYNLVNRIADFFSGSDEIQIINPVLSFITHLELLIGAAVR